MTKNMTFFYPASNHDAVKQFLKDTYPDQTIKQYLVEDALKENLIQKEQVPKQINPFLFDSKNPAKITNPERMSILFTTDPDFSVKLKEWWFGEKHLAYARKVLKQITDDEREHGTPEKEIMESWYGLSFPTPLLGDGSLAY